MHLKHLRVTLSANDYRDCYPPCFRTRRCWPKSTRYRLTQGRYIYTASFIRFIRYYDTKDLYPASPASKKKRRSEGGSVTRTEREEWEYTASSLPACRKTLQTQAVCVVSRRQKWLVIQCHRILCTFFKLLIVKIVAFN